MIIIKKSISILLLGFVILSLSKDALSQVPADKTIRLLNSDVLQGRETPEGPMREYSGNVRLMHGNVLVTSDVAYQYFNLNRADLSGNVIIKQNDMILKAPLINYEGNTGIAIAPRNILIVDSNVTLTANRGTYNTNTLMADFEGKVVISDESVTITTKKAKYNRRTLESDAFGDVVVDDDSVKITSNYLHYNRKTKESRNYGNVIIKSKFNNVYLTGDTVINIPEKNYTSAKGKPVLFQIDSVRKNEGGLYFPESYKKNQWEYDTLTISADSMEAIRKPDDERYYFNGNVEIVKGNVFARSEKAIFFKSSDMFFLEGNPVVWYDSTQLHGDSIIVYIPDNELSMIHSFGNAIAVSRDDTIEINRKNQIVGYSIKIFFDDKKLAGLKDMEIQKVYILCLQIMGMME
jgi:lipopolysaccharide assembly outer membrane protein LptD (OstA)